MLLCTGSHCDSNATRSLAPTSQTMLGRLRRTWTERHGARAAHFHTLFAAATLAVFAPLVAHHGGWGSRVLSSGARPMQLTCRQMFWNLDLSCGQNGIACDPVTSASSWIPIRCPARCNWPDASLIVRGGGTATASSDINGSAVPLYRGDSRICVAAVHAGVVSPVTGGCALVRLRGPASHFAGSVANGVTSLASSFWFPKR